MYAITLNGAIVDRIEDGLIAAIVCLRDDQAAIELGNYSKACQALGALRAARDLTRALVDESTPLEVLAASRPLLDPAGPFEPSEAERLAHLACLSFPGAIENVMAAGRA